MFGLDDKRAVLNLKNMDYHQSVTEIHPNMVLRFAYLKDPDDVYPFNISGLDIGKESKQGKVGVELTAVITYKMTFVVNGKLVAVSLDLG